MQKTKPISCSVCGKSVDQYVLTMSKRRVCAKCMQAEMMRLRVQKMLGALSRVCTAK